MKIFHNIWVHALLSLHLLVFVFVVGIYEGRWEVYLLFTVASCLLLFVSVFSHFSFFNLFFGGLLWLGFWFKYSVNILLGRELFWEAKSSNLNWLSIDGSLLKTSIFLVTVVVAMVVLSKILVVKPGIETRRSGLNTFYKTHYILLMLLFVLVVAGTSLLNIVFGFYQRGLSPNTVLPYSLNSAITFLFLLAFPLATAVLFQAEIDRSRKGVLFGGLLVIFEGFMTNVSILSRAMVLTSSSHYFGCFVQLVRRRMPLKKLFLILPLFLAVFAVSIVLVNHIRFSQAPEINEINSGSSIHRVIKSASANVEIIASLFFDRWVGIEGVVAVDAFDGRGMDVWKKFWNDRLTHGVLGTYDREVILSPYKHIVNQNRVHAVSLPGIAAFLLISDSAYVFVLGVFLVLIIGRVFEFLALLVSGGNLMLTAVVCQIVAYRFAQFGYVPAQSYYLFGGLLLILVLLYLTVEVLRVAHND